MDELLDKKETFAFIGRVMTARGWPVSAGVVSSHAKHRHEYQSASSAPTPSTEKRDIAKLLQDRMGRAIEVMPEADLFDKDNQAAISNALKAQAQIDKREMARQKAGSAELAWALLGLLSAPPPQLEDGLTIEGEAHEVE